MTFYCGLKKVKERLRTGDHSGCCGSVFNELVLRVYNELFYTYMVLQTISCYKVYEEEL